MTALLEVAGLGKRFGGFVALESIDLEVRQGERLGLIGPNGSGKSTLVNCICGTLRNEIGSVRFADETLDGLLRAFGEQNATSLRLVQTADLDAAVPVPRDVPWFPKDLEAWSVRWVILHVINELARHAGHADIVRETLDGATMYDLIAGLEGWEIAGWVTPWNEARTGGARS